MGAGEMIFDRFDTAYRFPSGAVPEDTEVRFTLRLPRRMGVSAAYAEVGADGESPSRTLCKWISLDGGDDLYEVTVKFGHPGLYWYSFITVSDKDVLRVCEKGGGEELKPAYDSYVPFQLTVYKKDFTTPQWLKSGVMYQIFPDRFFSVGRACAPDRGRRLHEGWFEEPDYDNDPMKITNSDFFGGNLRGITEKLPYLASLGVTVIYLNPIFESYSNHRYDTGDYDRIDPMLGTDADFSELCGKAREKGIRIILDGVFSHTGADSRYFNKFGNYPEPGAYQSKNSKYFSWYEFQRYPDRYTCWWGVWSLPCINETDPGFLEYITGQNGIARKYIRLGASGWRLDVADELPDGFLDAFRKAVKEENPDAAVIGEVWEDASNKISYSRRRRYLLGDQLDSVMNYPFRQAVLDFAGNGDSRLFKDRVTSICEHYPSCVLQGLMNMLSTHDTPRAMTVLAGEPWAGKDRRWQHDTGIPPEKFGWGIRLLKFASALQYTLPGIPSLYYGDEAGMQGYGDPFNRCTFPWGKENKELTKWFKILGKLRGAGGWTSAPLKILYENSGAIAYSRGELTVAANGGSEPADVLDIRLEPKEAAVLLSGREYCRTAREYESGNRHN